MAQAGGPRNRSLGHDARAAALAQGEPAAPVVQARHCASASAVQSPASTSRPPS
jgi:hypothetical protein